MARHFYSPDSKAKIKEAASTFGYGHLLAARETNLAPWFEIAIDTIVGPWEIPMQGGHKNASVQVLCSNYDSYSDKSGQINSGAKHDSKSGSSRHCNWLAFKMSETSSLIDTR